MTVERTSVVRIIVRLVYASFVHRSYDSLKSLKFRHSVSLSEFYVLQTRDGDQNKVMKQKFGKRTFCGIFFLTYFVYPEPFTVRG